MPDKTNDAGTPEMPGGKLALSVVTKTALDVILDAAKAAHRLAGEIPVKSYDPGGTDIGGIGGPQPAIDPATILDPEVLWQGMLMDSNTTLDPVGIALSGGGTIGDFEVGALQFIYKEFLGRPAGVAAGFGRPRFDIMTGTSVGAINAGALAQGGIHCVDDLQAIWFAMTKSTDFLVLREAFRALADTGAPANQRRVGGLALEALLPFPLNLLPVWALYADIKEVYRLLVTLPSLMTFGSIADTARDIESYWTPGGPGLRGSSLAVARDGNGRRIVFARGYDDMLYARWQRDDSHPISQTTRWSRWTALGGPISSDPVAYLTGGPGTVNTMRAGVIARTQNEERYGGRTLDDFNDVTRVDPHDPTHYRPFMEWENVPLPPGPSRGRFSSQVTVVSRAPDGRAMAFCRDENRPTSTEPYNRSYFTIWDGNRWRGWTMFGNPTARIAGNITGCSFGDGALALFARTSKFELLHSFTDAPGAPGDWRLWDGAATSDVLVVLNHDIDTFWRGTDGQVWTRRKIVRDAAWSPQRPLSGGIVTSQLSYGRHRSGRCSIFARGLDDNLYSVRQQSVGGEWPANAWEFVGAPEGLKLVADPYTLVDQDDGIEVFVVCSDRAVWTIRQEVDGYGAWHSLGGNVWTGAQLRMCSVALETGEPRYVDELGRFAGTLEPLVSSNGDMRYARSQGALASCSAPGALPPIELNAKTWVDGGMRYGVPIGAAIAAGAKRVIAVATVAKTLSTVPRLLPRTLDQDPPPLPEDISPGIAQISDDQLLENYNDAGALDVLVRSFVELLVDATALGSLEPETPWPVPVWTIQQTFKTHEGATIDPGLIRINFAYGWMRAFDILAAADEQRVAAIESTDTIVRLRWSAWKAEARLREAFMLATGFTLHPFSTSDPALDTASLGARTHGAELVDRWIGRIRNYKRQLETALRERRSAGFSLDPETPHTLASYERFTPVDGWPRGWEAHMPPPPFNKIDIRLVGERVWTIEAAPMPSLDP